MKYLALLSFGVLLWFACHKEPTQPCGPAVDGFDFPVGAPNALGYYDDQPFGKNNHTGSDWNGVKGGNSDFGDPVYSAADGTVSFAQDVQGGWGKVVRIVSCVQDSAGHHQVEALYAHFDKIYVKPGQSVRRGEVIGTIGNANGIYIAHLHFEIREKPGLPLGEGYTPNRSGYLNPTDFIKSHRPRLPN